MSGSAEPCSTLLSWTAYAIWKIKTRIIDFKFTLNLPYPSVHRIFKGTLNGRADWAFGYGANQSGTASILIVVEARSGERRSTVAQVWMILSDGTPACALLNHQEGID